MTDPTTNDPSQNERLAEILAEYLESERSGQTLDREQLLAEHSDMADELRSFFADHDRMRAVAEPRRVTEDATLMPQRPSDAREGKAPAEPQTTESHGSAGASPSRDDDESGVLSPGTIIRYFGDYELLSEIARGGMGVVYKARQVKLNRVVAIKMILAGQLASQEDVRRFYSEAEAAANLIIRGSCRSSRSVSTTASISSRWAMSKAKALQQRSREARSNRARRQGCC